MNLYKLKNKDIQKSTEVLTKAFYNYPTFKYILGEKHNQNNMQLVFRFLIKYAILYGEAYASSPEIEGIILFSDYEDYNFNFFRSLRSGGLSLFKLGSGVGKRFDEYEKFSLKIHENLLKEPHQYVILLGVDPEKHGQGFGNKLLLSILNVTEEKGQCCYLETNNDQNVAFYKRFGFRVISEDVAPGNIKQFAMLKDF